LCHTIAHKETDGGVIATCSGKVSNEEFHQCLKEKFLLVEKNMLDEKMGTPRYSISDFADVTNFEVSVDAVKYSANLSKTAMKKNDTGLLGVVAPNDHEFGMGRLWQAYIGSQGERAKIFRTLEEAKNWIVHTLAQSDKDV
jgi:hypothetical protein